MLDVPYVSRCNTMQSPTTPLHSNPLTSAGTPPKKATALQLSPAPTGAGGVPTVAQTARNAVVSTTVSEVTKAALGPVLGSVAQTASVVGQLSTPIGIVGLALGAGGLALGAYGVYSVHRLRGTVAKLQAEMERGGEELASLQNVVQSGCRQLADCITDMSARLTYDVANAKDEIVETMKEGFQGLHVHLEAMEERDLQEKVEALVQQYRLCFSVLASGKSNTDRDCKVLEDDAKAALAKITRAMKAIPKGHVGRLPLVAMHTFVTRARIDARDMRSVTEASSEDPFREELLRQAMALLKEEVVALLASHRLTLYTAGVILARPLAQYRLLHQGLALALQGSASEEHLLVRVDGQLVPPAGTENVIWDDGLDVIREFFTEEREEYHGMEELKLATLSDLDWYREWKQLDRETLLSEIPWQVSVRQVLTELGVPVHCKWGLDMDIMEKVKALVLPSFQRHVEGLLTKELESVGAKVHVAVGQSASLGSHPTPSTSNQWEGGKCIATLPGHYRGVDALVFASDGTLFSGGSFYGAIKQWKGGKCIARLKGHKRGVYALVFASDGTLFSGSDDKTIKQWKGVKCIATLEGHTDVVWALAFASDGSLFSGSVDKTIKQWKGGKCIATLQGHTDRVRALAFALDGTMFSGSDDTTIKQWKGGKCIATLKGHTGTVSVLAFASDGTLFSGSKDATIKQWKGGKCIGTLEGHTSWVNALAFASDGTLFSGSEDATIKQWKGGKCIGTLEGHTDWVSALAFASDGTLFSGSGDETIKQWRGMD